MRILMYTVGVTAAASMAFANPPATHGTPKTTTTVQSHGNPHTTTGKPTTTTTTTTTTSTSGGKKTTTTTPTTTTMNPIATKISSHPQLLSKVQSMLPKGMTLDQASTGFKNQGQFIAALHVSQNLQLSFADLQTQMTKNNMSLGQAIQKVKGTSDPTAVKKAETEADTDIKTTTTTTTTNKKKNGK